MGEATPILNPTYYSAADLLSALENVASFGPKSSENLFYFKKRLFEAHLESGKGGGDGLAQSLAIWGRFLSDSRFINWISLNNYYGVAILYNAIVVDGHTKVAKYLEVLNNKFLDYWQNFRKIDPQDTNCLDSIGILNPDPARKGTKYEIINPKKPVTATAFYEQYHTLAIAEADYARADGIAVYSIGLGQLAPAAPSDPYQNITNTNHIKGYFMKRLTLDPDGAKKAIEFPGIPTYSEVSLSFELQISSVE
jgi:hypothetical protein